MEQPDKFEPAQSSQFSKTRQNSDWWFLSLCARRRNRKLKKSYNKKQQTKAQKIKKDNNLKRNYLRMSSENPKSMSNDSRCVFNTVSEDYRCVSS